MERLSVMASTADIQVRASRGRTTQELQRDALRCGRRGLWAKENGPLTLFLTPRTHVYSERTSITPAEDCRAAQVDVQRLPAAVSY